jgi:hypothetical protein
MKPAPVLLSLLAFASVLSAQNITTATLKIGGSGAFGSEGGDPPVTSSGLVVTATLDFKYEQSTGKLTLVVHNTTPVVPNEPTPLITRIYFNAPPVAVTGMTLLSQLGSGNATLALESTFDADLSTAPNPNNAGPYGDFSMHLGTPGGNVQGGISNPAATENPGPPNEWVKGPATFVFQVSGSTLGITAAAFARALPTGVEGGKPYSPAIVKFQGNGSAFVGYKPDCSPSSFLVGEPRIGHTVQLYFSGAPGCKGCLFLTFNPTPTVIGPLNVPAGPPYFEVAGGPLSNTPVFVPLTIPNIPALVGQNVYYFLAVVGPGSFVVEFSPRYEFTILP